MGYMVLGSVVFVETLVTVTGVKNALSVEDSVAPQKNLVNSAPNVEGDVTGMYIVPQYL